MKKMNAILGAIITAVAIQGHAESDNCKSAALTDHTCFQYGNEWGKTIVPDKTPLKMQDSKTISEVKELLAEIIAP